MSVLRMTSRVLIATYLHFCFVIPQTISLVSIISQCKRKNIVSSSMPKFNRWMNGTARFGDQRSVLPLTTLWSGIIFQNRPWLTNGYSLPWTRGKQKLRKCTVLPTNLTYCWRNSSSILMHLTSYGNGGFILDLSSVIFNCQLAAANQVRKQYER